MANVKIEIGERIRVFSPYNAEFPTRAKELGGRWDASARCWTFDPRDEPAVRSLCREFYGTDGSAPADVMTIRFDFDKLGLRDMGDLQRSRKFTLGGRMVCERPGRDWRVKLGQGVVLVDGVFAASGGSMKHPALGDLSGVVLEIRDLPRRMVEDAVDIYGEAVDVMAAATPGVARRDALMAELASLRQRIAEIEAELENEVSK